MYVGHIWRKNILTRKMTIFEARIFRELLETVTDSQINYIVDLKAFSKINISEECSYEH
jgi:hypothetical protein